MTASVSKKPIPHGTPSGYSRHKCRCDACRAAEVARQREWRERKRAERIAAGEHYDGCTPVVVRGKRYPSITAAAKVLGTSTSNIFDHLARHGHADFVGIGRGGRKFPRISASNAKPLILFGRRFESIRAAAEYLKVDYSRLHKAVRYQMGARLHQDLLVAMMKADDAHGKGVRAAA